MPSQDIYSDFSAFYDLYVGDWLDDLPFYLEYAQEAKTTLLEIGVGSGRLTIPLARAGHSVVAVDLSSSMLALLRRKLEREEEPIRQRITLLEADAEKLELISRHDLIILPFYTFNYFLSPKTAEAVLRRCARHLAPHGRLLIDVFLPLRHIERCPTEPILRFERADPETGCTVRGWNRYEIDADRQIETRHHWFETTTPEGEIHSREFTTRRRYYTSDEMEALLIRSGWSVESVLTGYGNQRRDAVSEQSTWVARLT